MQWKMRVRHGSHTVPYNLLTSVPLASSRAHNVSSRKVARNWARGYPCPMHRPLRLFAVALGSAALLGCLTEPPTGPITQLPQGGKHVLFIGNSLIYTNNLPRTVADLAESAGDTVRVLDVSLPNFAVIDHALGLSNAVDVIRSQSWDFVVLQQGPTTTQVNSDTLTIATKLIDQHVKLAGGRTANFMSWPHIDQGHLFAAVRQSALRAAQSVSGVFMPAGEAWQAAMLADPAITLYSGDGYHPGPLGTYLAALVVCEIVTGRDARELPDVAVVSGVTLTASKETVELLQRIAHETVAKY